MKRRVSFYTLGCKTNQYETEAMREGLASTGLFCEAGADEKSDLLLINTCTVTSKADKESRWAIRRFRRENPNGRIVITGCLAERDHEMLERLPGVSLIVKNKHKHICSKPVILKRFYKRKIVRVCVSTCVYFSILSNLNIIYGIAT